MSDRDVIPYYYGLSYEGPPEREAFLSRPFGLLAGRAMRQGVVGGADAGLWLENLVGVPLEPSRMMLNWGNETGGDELWGEAPKSDWTSYRTLPEAVGEFAGLRAGRVLDPVRRTGDVLRGENPYGQVDEINTPAVMREAMIKDVFEAAGMVAAPGMFGSRVSATTLPTFGGIGARGANTRMLDVSERALLAGKDADEVRRITGWFKGMEGKPRFEINDREMKIRPLDEFSWADKFGRYANKNTTLENVIDHEQLFKQYPELKNVKVEFGPHLQGKGQYGEFDNTRNAITIYGGMDRRGVEETLTHEIQHWIQKKEGFARGGSPSLGITPDAQKILDEMKKPLVEELRRAKESGDWGRADEIQKKIMMDLPQEASFKAYQNLAGEIEARDAAGRRTWDAEMREAVPPTLRSDAIIRMEGGTASQVPLVKRVQNRFQTAYDTAREKSGGGSWVDIAVLRDNLGLSQEKMAGILRRATKEGHALMDLGEPSVVSEHLKGGMVDGKLLVKLEDSFFENIGSYIKQDVRKSLKQMEVDEIERQLLR